jgi:hypothetical protein
LKSSALIKEAISLSTRNRLPLPHLEMIRSHLPLMIHRRYLILATLKLSLILGFQIPSSQWGTVVQHVEKGEALRQVAHKLRRVL